MELPMTELHSGADSEAGEDRRKFLATCGKFAVITPPAVTLLLSTSCLHRSAVAQSGGIRSSDGIRSSGGIRKARKLIRTGTHQGRLFGRPYVFIANPRLCALGTVNEDAPRPAPKGSYLMTTWSRQPATSDQQPCRGEQRRPWGRW